MATAVLIVALLTLAASLASWLFSQWLSRRERISGVALAVGGGGAVLLIGAVAFVIVAASTWWPQFMPVQDWSSPLVTLAPPQARSAAVAPIVQNSFEAVAPEAMLQVEPPVGPKEQLLAEAERYLEASEHALAIDIARSYLTDHPSDPEMRSMLARSLFAAQHPGAATIIPAAVVAEWAATDCVASTRSDEASRWMLDNGCGRVVAVLFASCQLSETACFTNALISRGWSYEPEGILMTAANDRPVPLRVAQGGPLVAPIFTIRDAAGARRQIRYLACEVTAPGVLEVLRESGPREPTQQRLMAELRGDACYTQVLAWSRSGHRQGASPDDLLRHGID
jgi:hypothetical protein